MTLPLDTYITTQAESDTINCSYLSLDGRDLLVYVTTLGALRVKEVTSELITTLVPQGVRWVFVANWDLPSPGRKVYFITDQDMGCFTVTRLEDFHTPPARFTLPEMGLPSSFSMTYRPKDNLWIMMLDNGAYHRLYTSYVWDFSICKHRVVWETSLDPQLKVSYPSVGLHDQGDILTVAVGFYNAVTQYKGVATYVTHLFKAEDEL